MSDQEHPEEGPRFFFAPPEHPVTAETVRVARDEWGFEHVEVLRGGGVLCATRGGLEALERTLGEARP